MSGPTALTALAAAGAVTLLTFVALARIADVFGGARHRQVMRLTGARPGTAAGPSTGPLGVAAAGVQALGRHLWRHQRLVTVQDLRDAGLEAAWITPRTVVATKLALGAGVGLALGLLTPWVPAMMVGAPIGGLLGFVVPSLDHRRAQGGPPGADPGGGAGRHRRAAGTRMVRDGRIEIPVSSSNGLSRTAPAGWIAMSPGSRPRQLNHSSS